MLASLIDNPSDLRRRPKFRRKFLQLVEALALHDEFAREPKVIIVEERKTRVRFHAGRSVRKFPRANDSRTTADAEVIG